MIPSSRPTTSTISQEIRNSDPRARPLACINNIEVCSSDEKQCWNMNEPTSNSTIKDDTPEFILLYSSLYNTDIYYSLEKRQGRSLLAQRKVSQYFSKGLGDEHWVSEVENWVWTALARTSINTWSVASGEDSVHEGKGGFTEMTKNYGNLCGRYKYGPKGYQSLRFVPILLVALWLPFIWIMSWNWKPIERKVQRPLKAFTRLVRSTEMSLRAKGARLRRGGGGEPARPDPVEPTSPPITTIDEGSGQQHVETDVPGPTDIQPSPITQSLDTRGATNSVSPVQVTRDLDERSIEWESLILWQLFYCLWYLSFHTCILLVLCIRLPFDYVWGKF
jgi:hypothetical protein